MAVPQQTKRNRNCECGEHRHGVEESRTLCKAYLLGMAMGIIKNEIMFLWEVSGT